MSYVVMGRGASGKMTLAELRDFVRDCDLAELPESTVLDVRTKGFSPIGIKVITADPANR